MSRGGGGTNERVARKTRRGESRNGQLQKGYLTSLTERKVHCGYIKPLNATSMKKGACFIKGTAYAKKNEAGT